MQQALRKLKQDVKNRRRRLSVWIAEHFAPFDSQQLGNALTRAGIRERDLVLVHSAWDAFVGFRGTPTDVIRVLQERVGPEGGLLMPTMPFTGTAVEFARRAGTVDVGRVPSRMGLISELFRRSPSVERSMHPTHPVAAWGADLGNLIGKHPTSGTPCGKGSPFEALFGRDGKILLLGTSFEVLTFYHFIEELLEDRLPQSPFTKETFELPVRGRQGEVVMVNCRLFEPSVSRRRCLAPLLDRMRADGLISETKVGGLEVLAMRARDVVATTVRLADQGIYCYE